MIVSVALMALALAAPAAPQPSRLERAQANYEALAGGRRHWNQLSPLELEDLRAFADALRRQARDDRTSAERCFDREFGRYGRTLTDLQQQLIDMRCRPIGEPLR